MFEKVWGQWTDVVGLDPRRSTGSLSEVISWTNAISSQLQQKTDLYTQQIMKAAQGGFALMENERTTAGGIYRKMAGG
jgi:hypothetical protein